MMSVDTCKPSLTRPAFSRSRTEPVVTGPSRSTLGLSPPRASRPGHAEYRSRLPDRDLGPNLTVSRSDTLILGEHWKAYTAGKHSLDSIQYDQQLDRVAIWMDGWTHSERCVVLEELLSCSNPRQIQLLWTVLQPSLHRDVMYTAKKDFPTQPFTPISTFYSRKLRDREAAMRIDTYYRINSAHLREKQQLIHIMQELKLPDISAVPSESLPVHPSKAGSGTPKSCVRNPKHPGIQRSVTWGSLERRHIQEEEVPLYHDYHQGSSLSSSSLHSLRARHKHPNIKRTRGELDAKKPGLSKEAQKLVHWYDNNWDDLQRNEFLQKILLKLDPRQHYYIAGLLYVSQYKDFISYLPEPVAWRILTYLTPKELLRASKVCRRWKQLCNNNDLWRFKCEQYHLTMPVAVEDPKWKKIYFENKNIKDNWNHGKCAIVNCKGHNDRVLCVTFDEHRMATGSVDKTIKIWDLDTGACTQTLTGHLRGVWCVKFFTQHLLISGAYDCAIKIWNLRGSGSCVRTLLGHEGPVWAIVQRKSILASGSQDKTARIWDASRCHLMHTLKGHHGAVYCIDIDADANIVITGSSDKTMRLWSVESGDQQRVIHVSDRAAIMAVSYSNHYIACSYGGKITLYSYNHRTNTIKPIRSYHEHRERIESILLTVRPDKFSGTMISGGRDGELKYWDITRDKSLQTYRGHRRTINHVYCDQFRIATASYDNKIKIWDFRDP